MCVHINTHTHTCIYTVMAPISDTHTHTHTHICIYTVMAPISDTHTHTHICIYTVMAPISEAPLRAARLHLSNTHGEHTCTKST